MNESTTTDKDSIAAIIRNEAAKLPKKNKALWIFVDPHIDGKAKQRAVNTFGAGAKEEEVLLLVNCALVMAGAKGVFLTDTAIYRSAEMGDGAAHIDYTSIGSVDFSTSESKPVLYINDELFCVGVEPTPTKLIADILVSIQRAISTDNFGVQVKARLETIKELKKGELISEAEYEEMRTIFIERLKRI